MIEPDLRRVDAGRQASGHSIAGRQVVNKTGFTYLPTYLAVAAAQPDDGEDVGQPPLQAGRAGSRLTKIPVV